MQHIRLTSGCKVLVWLFRAVTHDPGTRWGWIGPNRHVRAKIVHRSQQLTLFLNLRSAKLLL